MNFAGQHNQTKSTSPPVKVAVTGGACSGKTSVCNRLKEFGVKVVNSDVLAREAVVPGSPAYKNIVNYFGKKVLSKDGALNRQMLRHIIVKNSIARRALERFVHPETIRLMQLQMAKAENDGDPVVLVEVPLLFELSMEDRFDVVIVVSASHKLQIKRLMERDDVSYSDAKALLDTQVPDEEKIKRAEFVIRNDGSIEQMIDSVDLIYKRLMQKYVFCLT